MVKPVCKHWHAADGYHVDVSNLSPPEPMVAVLEILERPGFEGPLFMHHCREPVHLYPELRERGWNHQIVARSSKKILLKIARQS